MIQLDCDLNIEGRPYANGERVSLSFESELLNVRKGYAHFIYDIHSGGGQLPDTNGSESGVKSGVKRGRRGDSKQTGRSRKAH